MNTIKVHDKEFVPYLTHHELQDIVKQLAEKVYEEYKDSHVFRKHPGRLQLIQYFVKEKPIKPVGVGDGSK